MSCNQRLQSNPELKNQPNQSVVDENMIPADEPTGAPADITPDVALSPQEPQYDTTTPTDIPQNKPEVAAPKNETTPPEKTETPARPTEPAKPPVKKEEAPKKMPEVTPTPPVKKTEPEPDVKKVEPQPTETKPVETKKAAPITASNFIIAAYNTMVKEGKKIGPACNFYVGRVLEVLGFKKVDFLANDFDVAAKKMFKNYKVFTFTNVTELKRHLWSYRDRTGFILQWERVGAPGHIAIVERVGETLYIYQASLNKYTARVDKTTLERLLLVNNNKGVRVYSDLEK